MRLDKYLSDAAPFSRREIRALAASGAVSVNGRRVRQADERVDASSDVRVRGVPYPYRRFIYLMLNKPVGFLSATEDAVDPVVVQLVPPELRHFEPFPVGRLDKDTEGLLLLTNDGQFDHALTSPRKEVRKRYAAVLDGPVGPDAIAAFADGMSFPDFTAKPARLEISPDDPAHVIVEISEGKFHQVKRMCERVGRTVLYLNRVSIGGLCLDDSLPPGGVRELRTEEFPLLSPGLSPRD